MRTKLIIAALCVLLLLAVAGGGFMYGKAYSDKACLAEAVKREQVIQEHLASLRTDIASISTAAANQEVQMKEDMEQILARLHKSPTVIYKNGKCTPSSTYLDSIDQAINKANKK